MQCRRSPPGPTSGRQAGLSLVELAVVLLVTSGIAAMALPYAGKMLESAAHAVNAESGQELMSQLQGYVAQTGRLPDGMDSLLATETISTTNPGFVSPRDSVALYLDDGAAAHSRDQNLKAAYGAAANTQTVDNTGHPHNFRHVTLLLGIQTQPLSVSLLKSGFRQIHHLPCSPDFVLDGANGHWSTLGKQLFHATHGAAALHYSDCSEGITTHLLTGVSQRTFGNVTDNFNGLPPSKCTPGLSLTCELNYTPDVAHGHSLIVMGIGPYTSAIGVTMQQAPVLQTTRATTQPDLVYARYLAVIDVDWSGKDPARLVGIAYAPSTEDGWRNALKNYDD